MSLLVVGSIAFDSIKTPDTSIEDTLGGSSVYFCLAAGFFAPVRLVGVVGEDFPKEHIRMLEERGIDASGLEVVEGGETFRWSGEYFENMNKRETLSVSLNVLEDFEPKIPDNFRDSEFVFLANAAPSTQLSVLDQVENPKFVMADTMDLWIQTQQADLKDLFKKIDGVVINDDEALLLTDTRNIIEAGKRILDMGPHRVVVKKGEHGALLFTHEKVIPLPAYPLHDVRDPTGAGDSFAGGLMGTLARAGEAEEGNFKGALANAVVVSSYCCEDFGVTRLQRTTSADISRRFEDYKGLLTI